MYDFNLAARGAAYQEAERRRYRAECKARCLEANLERIGPGEFDALMGQIEAAQEELYQAALEVMELRWKYAQGVPAQG